MSVFGLNDLKTPEGAIKSTWHTAIFASTLLAILGISVIARPSSSGRISGGGILIDAALIILLGFGVKRRSRVCATLLFAYWVVNVILAAFYLHAGFSFAAVLFGIVYLAGMTGTYEYHQRLRDAHDHRDTT